MRPRSARVRARSGRRARMSIGALARETWRDMTSGTAWIGIWTLLAALLLGGGISLDVQVIAREARAAADYQASLASVRVVESNQAIDGATCRALAELDGVKGAIAIRKAPEPLSPAAMPSASLQTWEYTGGIEGVFDMTSHDPAASGIILAEQVASALGLVAGDEAALKSGASTPVKGVYAWDENDGRRTGYAYSALVPVPARGRFDACWVRLWPLNPAVDSLMRLAVIPGDEHQQVDTYSVNASLGAAFDGPGRYAGRITAPIAWILFGLGLGIGALSVRRRRLELASDLHAGVSRTDLVAKVELHTAVIALFAAILSVPVLTGMILRVPEADRPALWAHAGLLGLVGASGLLLGALLVALALREKKLFDYFKTR